MALIIVHDELVRDKQMFEYLKDSFDTMETVAHDDIRKVTTFRVSRPEIPKDDTVIDPLFIHFYGVKPFIIDFGL